MAPQTPNELGPNTPLQWTKRYVSKLEALKKHLKTWKVDVVLHDGAPNVGKNWLHDAFQQNQLTLQALKLATEFLMKGGWFVTKVFRSKDYNALVWVFQQFFKKVFATKPQASRTESAEIFVVCQYYKAPDRIDPKFLDAKYVFEEVDPNPNVKLNLMFPEKQRKRAEGYPDGDNTLYHQVSVAEFVKSNHHIELLNDCSEIVFDDERITNHPKTTDEIKECCKDIKVLGRKELRQLLTWRKQLQEILYPKVDKTVSSGITADVEEEDEDAQVQKQIEELQMEQARESKRKKKKVLKDKKKLRDKMDLKMVLPHDEPIQAEDKSLFQLSLMKNKEQLQEINKGDLAFVDKDLELADEDDALSNEGHPKYVRYEKDNKNLDGLYSDNEAEEDSDDESLGSLHEEATVELKKRDLNAVVESESTNPLVVDLDNTTLELKKKKKVDLWFSKEVFEGLEVEADEDFEIDQISKYYDEKGALTKSKTREGENIEETKGDHKVELSDSDDSDDSAYNVESQHQNLSKKAGANALQEQGEPLSTKNTAKKKKRKLDVEGLALGTMMIVSKKAKRDIIDAAWNRYTYADENLPDWFTKEEEKHNRKQVPVTKEMVEEYKQKLKEINARSIHKVAEAKARKKRKASKKLEKTRKRVEAITESADMTDKEKMQQIKTVYKKAGVGTKQKKEVTYVVAKKSRTSKRVSRPAGVKGRFKVVDPRMKKDNMKQKAIEKSRKKRGKKGNKK